MQPAKFKDTIYSNIRTIFGPGAGFIDGPESCSVPASDSLKSTMLLSLQAAEIGFYQSHKTLNKAIRAYGYHLLRALPTVVNQEDLAAGHAECRHVRLLRHPRCALSFSCAHSLSFWCLAAPEIQPSLRRTPQPKSLRIPEAMVVNIDPPISEAAPFPSRFSSTVGVRGFPDFRSLQFPFYDAFSASISKRPIRITFVLFTTVGLRVFLDLRACDTAEANISFSYALLVPVQLNETSPGHVLLLSSLPYPPNSQADCTFYSKFRRFNPAFVIISDHPE